MGIIPAYAGNTRNDMYLMKTQWDHPRVCGEHVVELPNVYLMKGSSPRMRGTLYLIPLDETPLGIIPAYAGNTDCLGSKRWRTRDHPRVCGEHYAPNNSFSCLEGSSPRMRGTPSVVTVDSFEAGIIPAYAGNTVR